MALVFIFVTLALESRVGNNPLSQDTGLVGLVVSQVNSDSVKVFARIVSLIEWRRSGTGLTVMW